MEQLILRLPDVRRATGISKATLYRLVKGGRFPRPVQLGARCVGWRASEIERWLEERPPARGEAVQG